MNKKIVLIVSGLLSTIGLIGYYWEPCIVDSRIGPIYDGCQFYGIDMLMNWCIIFLPLFTISAIMYLFDISNTATTEKLDRKDLMKQTLLHFLKVLTMGAGLLLGLIIIFFSIGNCTLNGGIDIIGRNYIKSELLSCSPGFGHLFIYPTIIALLFIFRRGKNFFLVLLLTTILYTIFLFFAPAFEEGRLKDNPYDGRSIYVPH